MIIGIVGYGVVGRHMAKDLDNSGIDYVVYDKYQPNINDATRKTEINYCDAAFVCVGTPELPDGSQDLTAILDVFDWLATPVIIVRSTMLPGTTQSLAQSHPMQSVVFVPEFIGEGVNAPYNVMKQPPFLIIGGHDKAQQGATQILSRLYNSECEFVYCTSLEAEIAKYAENYYLAMKVTWANEIYDICQYYGADYQKTMNTLTHDYRIGRSHTFVFEDKRGFNGRCLPKDTNALFQDVGAKVAPLLAEIIRINHGI